MIKRIYCRIYSDFIMPSRLQEYEALLSVALKREYYICSIERFWKIYQSAEFNQQTKYLILRHDIDSDVSTAQEMFSVEKHLGVTASYYFRLSTLDISFMQTLNSYGSEASYHYEEIATYAKKHHIKTAQAIYSNLHAIQDLFARNLVKLRESTGLPMHIVASHGDFVNRFLGIPNHELLRDQELRKENQIVLEVYDKDMMKYVTSRHSDTAYPAFWKPGSPLEAINKGSKVVYVLTHPRHWRVNIGENFKDDINRIIEGVQYKRNNFF